MLQFDDLDESLRVLQLQQRIWVAYNFPEQLGQVKASDVMNVLMDDAAVGGALKREGGQYDTQELSGARAAALARRDKRIVKTHHHGALGAAEEIGELCHALLKLEQGIRGNGDRAKALRDMADAVADTIIFLSSLCNTFGLDLQETVWGTWRQVRTRDWRRWPDTGRPPAEAEA
jgi:NTP pyrophosphatase (non-canonical NTP hydrolase)